MTLSLLFHAAVLCEEKSDLVFVVDNSESITNNNPTNGSWDNWNLIREFIVDIVESFNISPTETKVCNAAHAFCAELRLSPNTRSNQLLSIARF
jgi:hypothetical protein